MKIEEVTALCEERGLPYKAKFMETLSGEERKAGYIKIYIPAEDNLDCMYDESVWGVAHT